MKKEKKAYLTRADIAPDERAAKLLARMFALGESFQFMVGAQRRGKIYNDPLRHFMVKRRWVQPVGEIYCDNNAVFQDMEISPIGKTALECFLRYERLEQVSRTCTKFYLSRPAQPLKHLNLEAPELAAAE